MEGLSFPSDLLWILYMHKPKQMKGERIFLHMNGSIANCMCEKRNMFTLMVLKPFLQALSEVSKDF